MSKPFPFDPTCPYCLVEVAVADLEWHFRSHGLTEAEAKSIAWPLQQLFGKDAPVEVEPASVN